MTSCNPSVTTHCGQIVHAWSVAMLMTAVATTFLVRETGFTYCCRQCCSPG